MHGGAAGDAGDEAQHLRLAIMVVIHLAGLGAGNRAQGGLMNECMNACMHA